MTIEENKALALRFLEAFNTGNVAAIDELVSPNYVQHSPGVPPSREALITFFKMFVTAFPDGHFHLEDMVAEGDKVLLRWTCSGTHQGPWMGIPATGKQVSFIGMDLWRFADGKVVEAWFLADNLSIMQQLGLLSSMARR
jgi:C-1 hydroxylase